MHKDPKVRPRFRCAQAAAVLRQCGLHHSEQAVGGGGGGQDGEGGEKKDELCTVAKQARGLGCYIRPRKPEQLFF